ncbi:MAG: ABATE domain-containing protein, partial [Actinomycetota bacterium]|nr:ABATE domain-containing protein [Actinomycetota bacterium]
MELVAAAAADQALLLDLLNTTPVIDGVVRDDLAGPDSARKWLRARGVPSSGAELSALLEVRPVLQGVVRGDVEPVALRRFLDGVRLQPVMGGTGLDWQLAVDGGQGAARAVLA